MQLVEDGGRRKKSNNNTNINKKQSLQSKASAQGLDVSAATYGFVLG